MTHTLQINQDQDWYHAYCTGCGQSKLTDKTANIQPWWTQHLNDTTQQNPLDPFDPTPKTILD